MKTYFSEGSDYIEIKRNARQSNCAELSIRVKSKDNSSMIITANIDVDMMDKIIAELISIKSQIKPLSKEEDSE